MGALLRVRGQALPKPCALSSTSRRPGENPKSRATPEADRSWGKAKRLRGSARAGQKSDRATADARDAVLESVRAERAEMDGPEGPDVEHPEPATAQLSSFVFSPTWAQVVRGDGRRMSSHTMVLRRQTILPGEDQSAMPWSFDVSGASPASVSASKRKRGKAQMIAELSPVSGFEGVTPGSRGKNVLDFAFAELRKARL